MTASGNACCTIKRSLRLTFCRVRLPQTIEQLQLAQKSGMAIFLQLSAVDAPLRICASLQRKARKKPLEDK